MAKKRANGEGTVFKRSNGSWQGEMSIGRNSNGTLKKKYFYGKTQREVIHAMEDFKQQYNAGSYIEPNKLTLGQWIDTWLWDYKKATLRPNTFSSYEQNIRVHIKPCLGHILLQELKPEMLQNFYNEKFKEGRSDGMGGLSSATIDKIHSIIGKALKQAVKNQLITRNVNDLTEPAKVVEKEINPLQLNDQVKLMKVIKGDRMEAAFLLDLSTGLRIGELLALRWSDIDLDKGFLRVNHSLNRIKVFDEKRNSKTELAFGDVKTKSGKRGIPIPSSILPIILQHKKNQLIEKVRLGSMYEDRDLVFCTEFGKPIEPRNMMRKFYKIMEKAGLERKNFHSIRHTFATRALEKDIHPKIVQEILGHADIGTTLNKYSHVLPDIKKAASEKLNVLFDSSQENKNHKAE